MAKSSPEPPSRRQQVRLLQQQEAGAAKRRRLVRQLVFVGALVLIVAAMIGTAVFFGLRGQADSGAPTADTTVTLDNVEVPFAIDGSAVRLGPSDAKAKIDLWVDYSCPYCQQFEAQNTDLINQLIAAGDTSVSYHNIHIDTDYAVQGGSAGACVATNDPDKWPAFNAALYANHGPTTDGWTASQFADFAAQQGVNSAAQTCIRNARYTDWITSNTSDSTAQGVTGTPTMVINGEKQDPTPSGDQLKTKVDQLVGR